MSDISPIEWTGATWNPVTGCTRVSPGCDNCYALTMAGRLKAMGSPKYQHDGDPRTSGPGFGVTVHPDAVNLPLRWRTGRLVFVDSMGDLFHADVPTPWIADIFAVMAVARQHTFQLLTKRHGRMRSLLTDPAFVGQVRDRAAGKGMAVEAWGWPLPGVWLGVSAEDQAWAELRVPALLETPAAVRFVSVEPMLGPVDLTRLAMRGGAFLDALSGGVADSGGTVYAAAPACLDWVICGGESGHGARPMHPAWARDLRNQTKSRGRAYFMKQMGSCWATDHGHRGKGGEPGQWPEELRVRDMPRVYRGQLSTGMAATGVRTETTP